MLLHQNSMASNELHNSIGLPPALPPVSNTMPNAVVHIISNLQTMANGIDWKEELYLKIPSLKELHLSELIRIPQKIASEIKRLDSLSHPPQDKQRIERLKAYKIMAEQVVRYLQLNKCEIQLTHKVMLPRAEKLIDFFLRRHKPASSLLQGKIAQTPVQLQRPQSLDGQTNPLMQPVQGSSFLADSTTPDGTRANVSAVAFGTSSYDERLIEVTKSMSPRAFSDLVGPLQAMSNYALQARDYCTQDGPDVTKTTCDVVSSCVNDLEETTSLKRRRLEANHSLVEEIRDINRRLIGTIVEISEEGIIDPEGGKGTTINCSFTPVALSPNFKPQCIASQMSPFQPLRLLVPAKYPDSSVFLLDEHVDGSMEAKSRFIASLPSLSQPMSLKDVATTWDACARSVISECAQQLGGGTFRSKYGYQIDF